MMNMNQAGFGTYLNAFDRDLTDKHIAVYEPDLSGCVGSTIDELVRCLESYAELQGNINRLFSATSNYMHKAHYNISLCEADNSV